MPEPTRACHAEIGAIKKIKHCNRSKVLSKNPTIYSLAYHVTYDLIGNIHKMDLRIGKPCKVCTTTIQKLGFKNVRYSDSNGDLHITKTFSIEFNTSLYSSGSTIVLNLNKYILDMFDINSTYPLILPFIDSVKSCKINMPIIINKYNKYKTFIKKIYRSDSISKLIDIIRSEKPFYPNLSKKNLAKKIKNNFICKAKSFIAIYL